MTVELHNADSMALLRGFDENSIDACVTDGPYGIRFMGKAWDGKDIEAKIDQRRAIESADPGGERFNREGRREAGENAGYRSAAAEAGKYDRRTGANAAFQKWSEEWAREVYRVLKPGAWLISFSSTRTYHRMTCGIEDAGFEIRDQLGWVFFSGFPKSMNRGLLGTALKPAWEPICLARKPLDGTYDENFAKWGTGFLNINGCRVPLADGEDISVERPEGAELDTNGAGWGFKAVSRDNAGRWPPNIIHDGSPEVVAMFPQSDGQNGDLKGHSRDRESLGIYGDMPAARDAAARGDSGSAARFFAVAKASRADRDAGCEVLAAIQRDASRKDGNPGGDNPRNRGLQPRANFHPTVKPTELMRYLCRLVTPPGGTVIDPFMGSGSTGRGAVLEGFGFIGIEKEELYMPIARARIAEAQGELFATVK